MIFLAIAQIKRYICLPDCDVFLIAIVPKLVINLASAIGEISYSSHTVDML
jgi:hypothetical protein